MNPSLPRFLPFPAALALLLAACSRAQNPTYAPPPPPADAPYASQADAPPLSASDQLDQLLGPIALYPDPLLSLILPASTFPSDLTSAASYVDSSGDPDQVAGQPWDPSVKALVHYPAVVTWMAQNTTWTQAVGAAFAARPADVMAAVQHLREIAKNANTLTSNAQQQVVVDGNEIEIEPAQPNVLYLPQYDPAVVYVDQPYYGYGGPFFTYGPAWRVGPWLTYGLYWGAGTVVIADWSFWRGPGGHWGPDYRNGAQFRAGAQFSHWSFPANRTPPRVSVQVSAQFSMGRGPAPTRAIAGLRPPSPPPAAAFRNPSNGRMAAPAPAWRAQSRAAQAPAPAREAARPQQERREAPIETERAAAAAPHSAPPAPASPAPEYSRAREPAQPERAERPAAEAPRAPAVEERREPPREAAPKPAQRPAPEERREEERRDEPPR